MCPGNILLDGQGKCTSHTLKFILVLISDDNASYFMLDKSYKEGRKISLKWERLLSPHHLYSDFIIKI